MLIRKTKNRILMLSIAAIIAAGAAYGSLAYFTSEGIAQNTITAGNIKIEVVEMMTGAGEDVTVPFEDQINVLPGCDVSKIVRIKNTGRNSAYIRVAVDKALTLAEGVDGEADVSLVSFRLNAEYWTELDGFYYYNQPLAAGELTEPLFSAVSFSGKMGNIYQNGVAYLTVHAYATQVANNGSSVFDAAGWPEAE